MSTTENLRVAVVGAGAMGSDHVRRITSTIAAQSAPVPHPTSSQRRPAGMFSHERNTGATSRLHRPTYCS